MIKEKKTSAKILIPYKRAIYSVLRHEKWSMKDDPLIVPEILGQTDPVPSKKSIFARSASAVRPTEKSLSLMGSPPIRAFQ